MPIRILKNKIGKYWWQRLAARASVSAVLGVHAYTGSVDDTLTNSIDTLTNGI